LIRGEEIGSRIIFIVLICKRNRYLREMSEYLGIKYGLFIWRQGPPSSPKVAIPLISPKWRSLGRNYIMD
jgi:hypothetical protein